MQEDDNVEFDEVSDVDIVSWPKSRATDFSEVLKLTSVLAGRHLSVLSVMHSCLLPGLRTCLVLFSRSHTLVV